jgi:hypothetical protein
MQDRVSSEARQLAARFVSTSGSHIAANLRLLIVLAQDQV